jgi:hypothetical protein
MNERRNENISTADIANRPDANKEEEHDQRRPHEAQDGRATTGQRNDMAGATADNERQMPASAEHEALQLIPQDAATGFRDRWSSIQIKFVDEPKDSVREADGLVAEVVQVVAQKFAEARKELEGQWSQGSEVSTEDLRQALQHYRSFFQRLLAA